MADDLYYGSPTFFNKDVTFYGDVNVYGKLNFTKISYDSLYVRDGATINQLGIAQTALVVNGDARVTGIITASQYIVSNGSSIQFLKADGTLDSTTYLTAASVGGISSNVPNTIVQRNGLGGFSAGIITATTFSGNINSSGVSTITTLQTNAIQTTAGKPILNSTGSILQVIHTEYLTATALSCAALTDISGFSTSITPSSTSSKVLVMVHFSGVLDCDGHLDLKVGGSVVKANLVGSDRYANASGTVGIFNYNDAGTYCASYLHSPASTSALTYQIAVQCSGCSVTAYLNRDPSNSNNNGRCGITLMEVSG